MNYIDIALCIPLVFGFYRGFVRGLIIEVASLVALGLGIWGGVHFSDFCADKIRGTFNWQSPYLPVISFATVFLIIVISIFLLARLLSTISKKLALGGLDKILGAVVGTLKFALILSVIIFVMDAFEKSYPLLSFDVKHKSVLYQPVGKIAPALIPAINNEKLLEKKAH
jgi:membrane protein required for colicin V production